MCCYWLIQVVDVFPDWFSVLESEIEWLHFMNLLNIYEVELNENCKLGDVVEWLCLLASLHLLIVWRKKDSCIKKWLMQLLLLKLQDPDLVIWSSLEEAHLGMFIKGKDKNVLFCLGVSILLLLQVIIGQLHFNFKLVCVNYMNLPCPCYSILSCFVLLNTFPFY